MLVTVFVQLSYDEVIFSQAAQFDSQFAIMGSWPEFISQVRSTVWQQSVEGVVLVPQNSLEQIVVHIVNESDTDNIRRQAYSLLYSWLRSRRNISDIMMTLRSVEKCRMIPILKDKVKLEALKDVLVSNMHWVKYLKQ